MDRHRRLLHKLNANNTLLNGALGKVTALLSFGGGTITGSGYSSVPDLLGGSPAVQATDARRPAAATAANGLPIATFTDDFLSWPLSAANNSATLWGWAAWVKLANTTGNKFLFSIINTSGGANANKLTGLANGNQLRIDASSVDRHASVGTLDTNWRFVYMGVDCAQATEATQVLMAIDAGAFDTVSFTAGTPWPATLPQPTGNMLIGAQTTVPANPLVGSIGPLIWQFGAQLTLPELLAISQVAVPT